MQIHVRYGKQRLVLETTPNDRVSDIRERLKAILKISELLPYKSTDPSKLQLMCNNVKLGDTLALADVGLKSGEMITCELIEKAKIFLRINVKFLKRIHKMHEVLDLRTMYVHELRQILQNKLGLPVSCFRLLDNKQVPLFDCHTLGYYGIMDGSTLHLDTWDDWTHFLVSAFNGDINETLEHITNWQKDIRMNRYQMRVACFIAAHMDLAQLAAQLIKRGVRVDEPIGEHPSRDWCADSAHPDIQKTPIHQAAQMGSFSVLRIFLRKQPTSIIARDGSGLTACNLSRRFQKIECFKLLIGQTFSTKKIMGFTLSTLAKMVQWANRAKDRVAYYKFDTLNKDTQGMMVAGGGGASKASVGNKMFIDGYGTNEIWDKYLSSCREKTIPLTKKFSFANVTTDALLAQSKRFSGDANVLRLDDIREDDGLTPSPSQKKKNNKKKKTTSFAPGVRSARGKSKPNVLQLTKENIESLENTENAEDGVYHDPDDIGLNNKRKTSYEREESRMSFGTLPTVRNVGEIKRTNSMIEDRDQKLAEAEKKTVKLPNINKVSEIDSLIKGATGLTSRELAQKSLKLSQKFHEKNWSRSLEVAMIFSKRAIDTSERGQTARSLREKNTI